MLTIEMCERYNILDLEQTQIRNAQFLLQGLSHTLITGNSTSSRGHERTYGYKGEVAVTLLPLLGYNHHSSPTYV
jgi:hypothetical protein